MRACKIKHASNIKSPWLEVRTRWRCLRTCSLAMSHGSM